MSSKDVITPLGILPGNAQEYSTIDISHQPLLTGHLAVPAPPRPHPRSLQALGHRALVEPGGRSSGTRRDWTVSPLSPPPSPGLFPSSPNPLHPASSPGTQTHTGLRRGDGGPGGRCGGEARARQHPPRWPSCTSSGARSARASRVWGRGGGWGANSDATRALRPPATACPGRDRSLLLLPHYRGERGWRRSQTAAEGAGRPLGSLARIKYLLCFVWPLGEGQEGCSIRPELPARRGPEVEAGFGPRAPH